MSSIAYDQLMEVLPQEIEVFNEKSRGAITLATSGDFAGATLENAIYKSLYNANRIVDINNANGNVTPTNLEHVTDTDVKIVGSLGPIAFKPIEFGYILQDPINGLNALTKALSNAIIQKQLNVSVEAAVAAIGNNAAATTTYTGNINNTKTNTSLGKFGDARGRIVATVMDGATFTEFVGENIANQNRLYMSDNVQIVDILGQVTIVTDAPSLSGGKVLQLVRGGVTSTQGRTEVAMGRTAGGELITTNFQADYTFDVKVSGYNYTGTSATEAAIGTGTNWAQSATDVKGTAGLLLTK